MSGLPNYSVYEGNHYIPEQAKSILYLATLKLKASEGPENGFDQHFIKKSECKKCKKVPR